MKAQIGYKYFIPWKGWLFGSNNNKDKTKLWSYVSM